MNKDMQRNGLNIENGYTLESAGKVYYLGDILNAEIADSGEDSAVVGRLKMCLKEIQRVVSYLDFCHCLFIIPNVPLVLRAISV